MDSQVKGYDSLDYGLHGRSIPDLNISSVNPITTQQNSTETIGNDDAWLNLKTIVEERDRKNAGLAANSRN
jgi:hypothetical protein